MKLGELAGLIRSKNAGPFQLTFDIMFDREDKYRRVVAAGVITEEWFKKTYGIPEGEIGIYYYEPAWAIKVTIPRPVPSGDPLDTDVYGGQQYGPLVNLEIP
ncbi:MAG: DUF4387 domain-containing protein [Deltaproteobacteria bacterium]|nr:DUF4387 domain-containing protein [Deltaproteobacteria bacterium]MBW2308904.1 DUF4387 domain-containing protein [Deltaproteobacteria bacterium]